MNTQSNDIILPRFDSPVNTPYAVRHTVGYASFRQHFATIALAQAHFADLVAAKAENVTRIGFASWDK